MYKFSSLTSYKMSELGSSLSGICICKITGGLFPITKTTIYCKPQSSIIVLSFKIKLFIHVLTFFGFEIIITSFPPFPFLPLNSHISSFLLFQMPFFINCCYMHTCIYIYIPKYNPLHLYNVICMHFFR